MYLLVPVAACLLLMILALLYYVYNGAIGGMGSVGNTVRIIRTFSFDTTAGNHKEAGAKRDADAPAGRGRWRPSN